MQNLSLMQSTAVPRDDKAVARRLCCERLDEVGFKVGASAAAACMLKMLLMPAREQAQTRLHMFFCDQRQKEKSEMLMKYTHVDVESSIKSVGLGTL